MTQKPRKSLASVLLTASVLLALGPIDVWAAVPTKGTLHAEKDCEAYVSKKKKSNPDKARLEPGDAYVIIELNRPNQPDWYRVRVEDANPSERWVPSSCGTVTLSEEFVEGEQPNEPEPPSGANLCGTAGLQDSYKLALSWQPAFCESHRSKQECAPNAPTDYQAAGNFTLHGMWPNREACGTNYGNCEHMREQRQFCNYPALDINATVAKQLSQVMPGTASCLERHEWYKHGTCQQDWDTSQYFEVAMDLVRQFNASGMSQYMAANMGKTVSLEDFLTQVDRALGEGARDRLRVGCVSGSLTDLYVSLPAHIEPGTRLPELLKTTPPDFSSTCPRNIRIDAVGLGR